MKSHCHIGPRTARRGGGTMRQALPRKADEPNSGVQHRAPSESAASGLWATVAGLFTLIMILAAAWPAAAAAGDAAAGAKIFTARCARCHGKDGKGNGPDLAKLRPTSSPVDWTKPVVMRQWSDQEIIDIITKGGKAVGSSAVMPKFGGKLTDAQIKDLLAFIRSLAK